MIVLVHLLLMDDPCTWTQLHAKQIIASVEKQITLKFIIPFAIIVNRVQKNR